MHDLRRAVRQVRRAPGFSAVAILTLALGMGATTAFFSALYGVVLRQPSYPDATRLVVLQNMLADELQNGGLLSRAEFREYGERQRALASLAASDLGRMTLTAQGDSDGFAERVKVSRVTPTLFPTLGVTPVRGRGITSADAQSPVAVLSHELWQTRFGGDANVLAGTLRLNGVNYQIIGVMPADFAYPESGMAAWLPIDLAPRADSDRGDHYLAVIGRLAEGVSADEARDDLQRVARQLRQDAPGAYPTDAASTVGFDSLRHRHFGRMFLPLATLTAAAAAVLLIACVNVAIMSLLRALDRRREIAIRLALGAPRAVIVRQLLTEAAVLCALGAVGGLLIASIGLDLLRAFAPGEIPRLGGVGIDVVATAFSGAALIVVTLIVGVAPAAVAARMRAYDGVVPSNRSSEGRVAVRLRDSLTIAEITLAAALVLCAGLTLRSLQALTRVDMGFATEHIVSFKTNLTPRAYPTAERADRFYERLTEKLAALPGTSALGAISYLPLSGEGESIGAAPMAASTGQPATTEVGWRIVRGQYFQAMQVPLLGGRLFEATDRAGTPLVAIVDDRLARQWFGSESAALGKRVKIGASADAPPRTIVGIVRYVNFVAPGRLSLPTIYAPQSQVYQRGMYTVLKTTQAPAAVLSAAREALAAVDPTIPMYFADSVETRYDAALALPRFTAGLTGAFSLLALVLAGVGVFGVTAYGVRQRTHEFGIRTALGAQRTHICRLVLVRVGLLAAIGLGIGGACGLGLGSLMSGLLFGVEPADWPSMATAVAAIAATTLAASTAPLRHALRLQLADLLRAE